MATNVISKQQPQRALSLLVPLSIALIAYVDSAVVTNVSLGLLYFVPLALSALVHRLPVSFFWVLVCLILRETFGPFQHSGWPLVVRSAISVAIFSGGVLLVHTLAKERRRLSNLVHRQQQQLTQDAAVMARIQQRLLPKQTPAGGACEIAARLDRAELLDGNLYDFVELPDRKLALFIVDVSGKGMEAAMLLPSLLVSLRMLSLRSVATGDVLTELNQTVYQAARDSRYVAAFYALLDPQTGYLQYTNAGHPPPLLFRPQTGIAEWLETGGPVAGVLPEAQFESAQIQLQPGDLLLLYSDGIVSAENTAGERFSQERLASLAAASAGTSMDDLVDLVHRSVTEFRAPGPTRDDLTVVALRRRAGSSN